MTRNIVPKRIEYDTPEKRLVTFAEWPQHHTLCPLDAALAGYYYTGYGDCVRCFSCGGGVRNWEPEDNVWVEHARWFPKCDFLISSVGSDFVQVVTDLMAEHGSPANMEMVQAELRNRIEQNLNSQVEANKKDILLSKL